MPWEARPSAACGRAHRQGKGNPRALGWSSAVSPTAVPSLNQFSKQQLWNGRDYLRCGIEGRNFKEGIYFIVCIKFFVAGDYELWHVGPALVKTYTQIYEKSHTACTKLGTNPRVRNLQSGLEQNIYGYHMGKA